MQPGVLLFLIALLLLPLATLLQTAGFPTSCQSSPGISPNAGDLPTTDSMVSDSCIYAKKMCLADSTCSTPFFYLETCFASFMASAPQRPENQEGCLEAAEQLKSSYMDSCRCQWRMKNQDSCLAIYWTIHFTRGLGDYDLGGSPYKENVFIRPWKFNHQNLDLPELGSLSRSSSDPCLQFTTLCTMNEKCNKFRLAYGEVCSVARCQPIKCQQELRVFFEQVADHFAQALLFCPCADGDEDCGERRRNTIAPSCASPTKDPPNCLKLWDSCLQDLICRSRLADFQMHCCHTDPLRTCVDEKLYRCRKAYMGLIGTDMTPNYISNLSTNVSVSCSCKGSGNQLEECKRIEESFSRNPCLTKAIESRMQFHHQLLSKSSPTAKSRVSMQDHGDPSYSVINQDNNMAERLKPWVPSISTGSLTFVLLLLTVLGY